MPTSILTRADVARLLTMDMALAAVERAFLAHGRGEARMPSKVYLDVPEHAGDFRAMPAFLDGAAGVKWVNSHPENPARHQLPSVMGVYILSDPATARPLAVMDATLLTAFRTGAASGVATKFLAAGPPRTLGFVGCGVQARYLLDAHRALYPGLELVMADVSEAAARRFAEEAGGRAGSVADAAGCDVVCTSTPVRKPVVRAAWVRPGAHINAMGADAEGKQELDTELMLRARVFVDDLDQASHSGEVNVPLAHGDLRVEQLAGTIGQVIAGKVAARPDPAAITVFDSTGLAVQDVALARLLLDAAVAQGAGVDVELVG
jgi:ornithine cyclodeaminase/alanine dehydrogenase